MITMTREYGFSAAHSLPHLPEGHPCRRVHGHTYRVRILLAAHELDTHGFVLDYADLDPVGGWLTETFDHRNLDDVLPGPTTAERLAYLVAAETARTVTAPHRDRVEVAGVGISEHRGTWVWWWSGALLRERLIAGGA